MKRVPYAKVVILLIIATVMFVPLLTFAIPQSGDQCTTDYFDTLVGSDGRYFYRSGVQNSIRYYADGSAGTFSHENYSGPRQHYLIKPDRDPDYYGYCIQQGESFPDAQRYTGAGWTNDSYFSKLPDSVRNGIMLATIFGWQPGKQVPVLGCNDDDWYWATQVIIWEYQQQLRSSPTMIQGNGCVSSNYFQSTLAGRPAEKCYNYILESISDYQKIPSFTASESSSAPINILTWDSSRQLWTATINDNNQTGHSLISDDSTLRIEQNGNQYTFSSPAQLDIKTIKFRKNVPMPSHELLIWGGANRTQAIATGSADPILFYAQFRTEQPGSIEIVKTSEDQNKEDFIFRVVDQNGQTTNLTTNKDGLISAQLYPGKYMVTEEENNTYRTPQNQSIEIKENETTRLEFVNILKKGRIQILKNVKDSISNTSSPEKDAVFQIYSSIYSTFANTPNNLRDEVSTDIKGIALTKELPLGNYILHQIISNKNVTLSKDMIIDLSSDLQTVPVVVDNQLQKGKILVFKIGESAQPLAGAEFVIKTADDITQTDGVLRYPKGTIIGSIISNNNGFASSEWLYPGNYEIEEVKAPEGHLLPNSPISIVELTTDNQSSITFFKQVSIQNSIKEVYPVTGDEARIASTRVIVILMLMSLIGIGVSAYMMNKQNKTLH